MEIRADLHIHTVLSPCGDLDMSPANIIGMALQKGLSLIGISDHNSTRQAPVIQQLGEQQGLRVLCWDGSQHGGRSSRPRILPHLGTPYRIPALPRSPPPGYKKQSGQIRLPGCSGCRGTDYIRRRTATDHGPGC